MREFGADESKFKEKLTCLDNLLHNYSGLGGMKDDFAKMLYASSSKLFLSKKGSQLLEDGIRMHRNSKQ